jgi:hypothetical protein
MKCSQAGCEIASNWALLRLQLSLKSLEPSKMPLSELLPSVNQLSHQDKLRLIHVLLLAVAEEDGCSLDTADVSHADRQLLAQMASTAGVVWSPQTDNASVQALFELVETAKANG